MRERIIAVFLLLFAGLTIWLIAAELPRKEYARPAARQDTPSVSREVIRLHILADSDSERDQAIKLALRDVLLPYLTAATLDAATKEEALAGLRAQCPALTRIANAALTELGVDYTATVSVENLYFPIRIYGSQTYLSEDAVLFPPGFYDSVRVVLGEGNGHNWWCLAYPSLCFIDSAYDYIPKDSEIYKIKIGTLQSASLEELFYTDSEEANEEITVYFGSKFRELLKNLFKKRGM